MSRLEISIPAKWEQYLKQLANDHQVDLNSVLSELCEWAFSNPEGKKQFKLWLDDAFPPKGEAEDEARDAGARESAREEEAEEESEEEAHEDENVLEQSRNHYSIEIWKMSDILTKLINDVSSKGYRDDILRTLQLAYLRDQSTICPRNVENLGHTM